MIVATSPSATTPLALVELPSRPVGPNDVRVRVRTIGLNPVDWKMRQGGPLRLAHHFVGPRGPLVVGIDFAGEVIEIGGAVTDLAIGARVVGATDFSRKQRGAFADEVVVGADQCARLPDGVSFDQAACLGVPGATATQALVDFAHLDAKRDGKVLVLGASGGVGLVAVQLARAMGHAVVGVCSTPNVALVERLGATVVDYTKGDALDAARAHGSFDLIFHAVGTATYPLAKCRSILAPNGTIALVVVRPFADALAIACVRGVRASLGRSNRALLERLVAMVADGTLECVIEAKLPLAKAEEALARSQRGKVVGKLLLQP